MMKLQKFVMALLLALSFSSIHAETRKIFLRSVVNGTSTESNQPNRAPERMPEVWIDGFVLSVDESLIGSTLRLVQNGIVVYSDVVTDENGQVVLPDSLSGEYELQFIVGSDVYIGVVSL